MVIHQRRGREVGYDGFANAVVIRVDFTGGDLAFYAADPQLVEVVPSASQGKIVRSYIVPNVHTKGFRAVIDVKFDPGQSADLRAFLRTATRALTETWTFPWRAE